MAPLAPHCSIKTRNEVIFCLIPTQSQTHFPVVDGFWTHNFS